MSENDFIALVRKYGDHRAGKALHNGERQRAMCDVSLSEVVDFFVEALARARHEQSEVDAKICKNVCDAPVQGDDGEWYAFDDFYSGTMAANKCAADIRAAQGGYEVVE